MDELLAHVLKPEALWPARRRLLSSAELNDEQRGREKRPAPCFARGVAYQSGGAEAAGGIMEGVEFLIFKKAQ